MEDMAKLNTEMFGLVAQTGPAGHALALQILGNRDDAADVVQDAAQSALQGGSFDAKRGEFHAWFLKIVRNRCLDLLRQRGRRRETPLEFDPVSDDDNPAEAVELDETINLLKQELAQLLAEQREILVLRDYLGMCYSEISEVLSIPEGTVMSRLHRARLALAPRMKRHYK